MKNLKIINTKHWIDGYCNDLVIWTYSKEGSFVHTFSETNKDKDSIVAVFRLLPKR